MLKGYEGLYQVSNYGEIKSLNYIGTNKKAHIRSPKSKFLSKNGVKTSITTGRIVAEHFVPNPDNKEHILHKDFNEYNNRATNLIWVTYSERLNYLIDKGRIIFRSGEDSPLYGLKNLGVTGENNHNCKLSDKQVLDIRKRYKNGETQVSLSKKFGVTQFNISRIVNRLNRTNI